MNTPLEENEPFILVYSCGKSSALIDFLIIIWDFPATSRLSRAFQNSIQRHFSSREHSWMQSFKEMQVGVLWLVIVGPQIDDSSLALD